MKLRSAVLSKNILTLLVCLAFLLLSIGCQNKGMRERQILAKIEKQTITVDEFKEEFNKVRLEDLSFSITGETSLNRLKSCFLNRLIERRILLAEAQKLGLKVTEDELTTQMSLIKKDYPGNSFMETLITEYVEHEDWKERIRIKLLIEKLIDEVIISNISLGDKEVEEYYQNHSEEFLLPEQVSARQIVVGTELGAREILNRLKTGEDFIKLAKDKSLSPDSKKGGDLGYFSIGQMPPEFDEVVFTLRIGMLSKVVKSPYGFHIFKVEDKRKARKAPLNEVCDQIKEVLKQERAEEAYSKWLKKKKNMANIEINYQLLKEINR